MTEIAEVRTVTVGGRPHHGPMQTASGNRGAAIYTSDRLDYDIESLTKIVQNRTAFELMPSRDTGMFTNYASINIRDQMRPEDLMPLQFRYVASDCRVYYTPQNVYNMSQLWRDVSSATWDNATLCVPDSTHYSKRTNEERKTQPRAADPPTAFEVPGGNSEHPLDVSFNASVGLVDGRESRSIIKYKQCGKDPNSCGTYYVCKPVASSCDRDGDGTPLYLCLPKCNTLSGSNCKPDTSRLPPSASQQPVKKRTVEPLGALSKFAPRVAPGSQLRLVVLPPRTNQATVNGRVYNGYIEPPTLIKTSDYISGTLCGIV